MSNNKINGLFVTDLHQIVDSRGAVFKFLSSNSVNFKGFGEVYYSKINFGIVKGWKLHNEIFQNFCVPFGKVRIVVFDNRKNSPSFGVIEEFTLDDNDNYKMLSMPPGLWYSFKCESDSFALLSNVIDKPHSQNESQSLPLINSLIPYVW